MSLIVQFEGSEKCLFTVKHHNSTKAYQILIKIEEILEIT